MFMDDDSEIVCGSSLEEVMEKAQAEADRACDWPNVNNMAISGEKTKFLLCGTREMVARKTNGTDSYIVVENQVIPATKSEKLLGIVVNCHMSYKNMDSKYH